MGADAEEYYSMGHTDRPGKKPSLHSRLQSGEYIAVPFNVLCGIVNSYLAHTYKQ